MPDHRLDVHPLPKLVAENALAGSTVVVIDLLRASTTICQALANGAAEVVPYLEIADAQVAASAAPDGEEIVLGGERGGQRIDGFDLGNSPAEYTRKAVAGKRVFLTTTNGTRALNHARLARRILVGSFVNLSAVADSIRDESRIDLLCAGTGGEETREDLLAAGALVDAICFSDVSARNMNDSAVARAASGGRCAKRLARLGEPWCNIWRSSCATRSVVAICFRSGWRTIWWIARKSMRSTSCLSWIFRHGEFARRSGRMMW